MFYCFSWDLCSIFFQSVIIGFMGVCEEYLERCEQRFCVYLFVFREKRKKKLFKRKLRLVIYIILVVFIKFFNVQKEVVDNDIFVKEKKV